MNYDFPVALQPITTVGGYSIPKMRAVVRTDTGVPLSVVSTKYQLVPYQKTLDMADEFMSKFGAPEKSISISANGDSMAAVYTYKERTLEVQKGDLVGFRIYLENSYSAKKSIRIRIGALRLSCLNGMVSYHTTINAIFRHTGQKINDMALPDPNEMYDHFQNDVKRWSHLTGVALNPDQVLNLLETANKEGIIPRKAIIGRLRGPYTWASAWEIYNDFTAYITHQSKLTPIGRLQKLSQVDRFFSKVV